MHLLHAHVALCNFSAFAAQQKWLDAALDLFMVIFQHGFEILELLLAWSFQTIDKFLMILLKFAIDEVVCRFRIYLHQITKFYENLFPERVFLSSWFLVRAQLFAFKNIKSIIYPIKHPINKLSLWCCKRVADKFSYQ